MSLDATGLVALADLATIQQRTVLTGTATLLDALVICPGIHLQQRSTRLNGGEYPACGALTSGYVFRVENPATVYYLQQVGMTGHLTNLRVTKPINSNEQETEQETWLSYASSLLIPSFHIPSTPVFAYGAAVLWGTAVIVLLGLAHDWWGLGVVLTLMFARLCNIIVIRRREKLGWTGASEPGVQGDLLVLLSQDRWIRIKGAVDHLKAVTSGQWLRDQSMLENWSTGLATLVVYLAAALVSNATQFGKILILALLGGSAALLAVTNSATDTLTMHGYKIELDDEEPRKKYERRLELANALIVETGRRDWAVRMGMVNDDGSTEGRAEKGPVVM